MRTPRYRDRPVTATPPPSGSSAPPSTAQSGRRRPAGTTVALVLAVGVLAASTSPLLIRFAYDSTAAGGSLSQGLTLGVIRLATAATLTGPSWLLRRRPELRPGTRRRAVLAGVLLAVHFGTWLPSLAYTSIVASTTIATSSPIWVALIAWAAWGTRPLRLTTAGIAVAVAGGVVIALSDAGGLGSGSAPLLGDLLALVAAVSYAGHLLLGRAVHAGGLGLGRWTAVVAGIGGVVLLPLALLTSRDAPEVSDELILAGLLLALIPQLVGHSSFTWSVRWVSPTTVVVVILLEPVLASLAGIILFDEVPGAIVILGAAILIAGVALTTLAEQRRSEISPTSP